MDLRPIPGIRGLSPVRAPVTERQVPPALAADGPGRTGDDTYNEGSGEAECGEEEDIQGPNQDEADTELDSGVPGGVIDLLA